MKIFRYAVSHAAFGLVRQDKFHSRSFILRYLSRQLASSRCSTGLCSNFLLLAGGESSEFRLETSDSSAGQVVSKGQGCLVGFADQGSSAG